ncbi:MAG: PadR family transcriptional regulator [Paludibacterium sp.]|uniref:PadR family transcriptional regulator n=1 Tax=Paludibacterium sp. TaxID=1917523 RepID=UPI0026000235|nr:PadR family transcriptional regulator [Paludibacterium sp.]MBV8049246.1 PadR family transcriptional regulator [Paludibacterium sp.]MBV8646690.1 PadR family transcriptional regulator [Paludibacterium sp.]
MHHCHRGAHGPHALYHRLCHAMGRHGPHRRHHGGDAFDPEGGDLTRGRKFSGQDLQLMLLALLAETPRHGYELIRDIEQRSSGSYTPSPGVVYPALTYLDDTGLVVAEADGNRKRYRLSDEGRAQLSAEAERVQWLLAALTHMGRRMAAFRRAMAGEAPENGETEDGWLPEFVEVRRAFKHALLLRAGADADEQRRLIAILRRALSEIEQGPAHGA